MTAKNPILVSFGGGANSSAMLLEMHRRGVRPDAIVFADTGGEKPPTYAFVSTFSEWLQRNGFPAITVVRNPGPTLEQDCLERRALPSVAFGRHFKSCSHRWKIRPIDNWLKQWPAAVEAWARGGKVLKLIGFDAYEAHRVKDYGDDRFVVEYPLIAWGMTRRKCIEVCAEYGFNPPKSSCFFCPNNKKGEILRMAAEHPVLAQRALAIERNAETTAVAGLGRDWSWAALLSANEEQAKLFPEWSEEMPCGCHD